MKGSCGQCRYFEPLGMEDSGIQSRQHAGNWFYEVGRCNKGVKSGDEVPSWSMCEQFKRKKISKKGG